MTDPTSVQGTLPGGLLDAFDAYEGALAANDQAALADAFEPGADTLRADGAGLLVGHEAITEFRGRRKSAPARHIEQCHVRVLDPATALIVSVNLPAAGGRGVVTQLWRQNPQDHVWRIASAQVQAPAPIFDTRIWRVVGAPLVASSVDVSAEDEPAAGVAPLLGETVAVKDLFAVAGLRIGAGVPAYLEEQSDQEFNSPAVQALLDGGAAVLGIAQTDEFAYSIAGRNSAYGTPRTVPCPARSPAVRRAGRPPPSHSATPASASAPTRAGRSASRPPIRGSGASARRTAPSAAPTCCPWRPRSTRSVG
ncbi:hypothetical protein GCM10025867_06800 [Frondihabitans sucicola]|uniref:Amidase domain-containing protein n=1 Tax=Frondihabitans sucicola TaxID=1268041 RepID=A0ABM8GJ84_9MICO|nr:hypothetical protein GCM10025867_06800 [Frondihabitans sucicola]